ncbi:MAG TPA: hypothetical protein VFY49_20575 [Myxococcota bacterium]|nr:hypothetical protein [Myxococcota bacterium]
MSWKQLALWTLVVDFALFTAFAIYMDGYFAFVPITLAFAEGSWWGAQVIIDFLLALAVATGFVVADARRRGIPTWPFVALTLTLGSLGPLTYLLYRQRREEAPGAATSRAAAQHA